MDAFARSPRTLAVLLIVLFVLFAPCGAAVAQRVVDTSAAPRMSQDDFKKKLAAGSILVIDVRDALLYDAGHIPGSISVPESELQAHAQRLKTERRPIVAYCG